ncbi:MAG: CCA tRNA nucleotidyltransferase [Bacilli bacterium]|nr:CCA tRNA nucleotidyltransferase [Bacilli bacterium]
MLEVALKLLKELTSHSYQAYIVGGFVRDYLLGRESTDIDITTNATPKEVLEIFNDSCLPNDDYGSVVVNMRGIRFDITTFRKEIDYIDNRRPGEIKYIDDLYQDLLRRDFTINALCMNESGEVLDFIGSREDLNNHIIKTIGDSNIKLHEDVLRILRAVRFATILDFKLDDSIVEAIKNNRQYLKKLSYQRKREELDKIFLSPNYRKGIKMLIDLGLDNYLELPNLSKVLETDVVSLIGIWSVLDVTDKYPFSKNECELINNIKEICNYDLLDPFTLYRFGLYVATVAGEIKGVDNKVITEAYNKLPIKSRKDINISADTIMKELNKEPGEFLKTIFDMIESEILYNRLENDEEKIITFIKDNY